MPLWAILWGGYKAIIDDTKTFRQLCVVTNRIMIKNDSDDIGKLCYWMGYTGNHSTGTHRLYNHAAKKIILSRDVTFLGESMENKKVTPNSKLTRSDEREYDIDSDNVNTDMPALIRRKRCDLDSSDDEDEDGHGLQSEMFVEYNSSVGEEQIIQEVETSTKHNPRVVCAMIKLQVSFNPEANRVISSQQSS